LKIRTIILILLAVGISSCASDLYVLNKFRNVMLPTVVGYRGDNPLKVNLIADDAVRIEDNSITALRKLEETQYHKTFFLKKTKDGDFSVVERTSPLEKGVDVGIKATFRENGIDIYESNNFLYTYNGKEINKNEVVNFQIIQDAKFTTMIVDCDTIMKHKTDIPGTEYTLFATGEGAELEIYSFEVNEIYESSFFW
jgi:hypothetical protein